MKEETYRRKYGPAANFIMESMKKRKKTPWQMTYSYINGRCNLKKTNKFKYYGGRGIRCLVTPKEIKDIFYRDKAYNMEYPSIDRINPNKDYTADNIRYIEFSENRCSNRRKGYGIFYIRVPSSHMETIRAMSKKNNCSIKKTIEKILIDALDSMNNK